MKAGKIFRRSLSFLLVVFIIANLVALLHAYKFTHFSTSEHARSDTSHLSFPEKIKLLFTGVALPRPVCRKFPQRSYTQVVIQSNVKLAAWEMKTAGTAKGTVILFHGYGGEKSGMLDRAYALLDMGYNVLLPDFIGCSQSEGNRCTIGFDEAVNVKSCVDYLCGRGENRIFLLGTSMGAAAVMRICSLQQSLPVKAVMLECPFGSMRQTVRNRFENMHIPYFPLGDFLVAWGGIENGFNAFGHNPEDYAAHIRLPVLLMYGEKDDRVRRFEIDNIYRNLAGRKDLLLFPLSGHESYLNDYPEAWKAHVSAFLSENN